MAKDKETPETPTTPPVAEQPQTGSPAVNAANAAEEPRKKKKRPGVPPRRGKKLRNILKNNQARIDKEGTVTLRKAIQLLKSIKRSKSDETVEIHMKLGIDTTQSDQLVRGSVPMPHGIGKAVRIAVFAQGDNVAKAQAAGADIVGGADLVQKIQQENFLAFDVALATQDMMGQVSRLGKILGPRGLMPTPKAGTVVPANQDIGAAIREVKAGKVEFRADKAGNVHGGIGKMSFEEDKLVANITAFVEAVRNAKPSAVKGNYVESINVSATQSPGVTVTM